MAGKRMKKDYEKVDIEKLYSLDEALGLIESFNKTKFDETVEIVLCMGVDPKQSDQGVRGACSLPHGTGKKVRVAAFAKGDKALEATEAGADVVGADDLAERVLKGDIDFDKVVATPDMMGVVGKLGKVLGPRGMMPNPKLGTVSADIGKAVKDIKAGKVEFRIDKAANLHAPVGKRSFKQEQLKNNIIALIEAVNRAKPSSSKGTYFKKMSISSTMSPGVKVDVATLVKNM
ncbi:MAG: 50S ribosomal protein L1 [Pseudomonadota bacterium]